MHSQSENASLLSAMRSYHAGDARAFATIHAILEPHLRPYLRRRVKDLELADEVLQDSFARIHRHLRAGKTFDIENAFAWSFTVTYRVMLTALKRRQQEPLDYLEHDHLARLSVTDPREDTLPDERVPALREAIDSLPPNHRLAIELIEIGGLSRAEAARETGTYLGTMRCWLHRGRERLREQLLPIFSDAAAA